MSTTSQFFSGGTSIKSIQRGTIALAAASSNTATISSVNTSKAELRLLGFSSTGTFASSVFPRIVLTDATTITATAGSSTTCTISWELTEWN